MGGVVLEGRPAMQLAETSDERLDIDCLQLDEVRRRKLIPHVLGKTRVRAHMRPGESSFNIRTSGLGCQNRHGLDVY